LCPNAWVSVKLPAGVADRYSLADPMPSDPTWAGTADPYFFHPPPDALVQACRVAVVLLCE
jgi:hypothetical protein